MPETSSFATYDGPDAVVESLYLKSQLAKERGSEWHIKSGFPSLNYLIGGFYGSEVTILTGPTKNGKTLLAQTLTRDFAQQGINSLWFSFEVAPRQFFDQFGEKMPSFFLPKILKGHAMGWLHERILESRDKFGCKIVFIDHLHYLIDLAQGGNASLHIGAIMRQLQSISKDMDIHIFLVVHNRKVAPEKDGTFREPGVGDTRDSSLIEQEGNNTIAIWRSETTDNKACIKVIHNRRFGIMNKRLFVYKRGSYLEEDV